MVTTARLFTTPPNWKNTFRVTHAFKTDIIVSRSGKEQRSAIRQTPRKTIEFDVMAHDDGLRALNRVLTKSQAAPVVVPEYTRQVATTSSLSSGGYTVNVASIPQWLKVGRTIVLASGTQMALRQVVGISGSTLTFDSSDTFAWPIGTKVYSGVIGRMSDSLRRRLHTNSVAEMSITFDAEPGLEPADTVPAAGATFNGREICPLVANWRDPPDVTHSHPSDRLDFGVGRITTFTPIAFGSRAFALSTWAKTAAEAESILAFFLRMKGRRGEFYMATGENDLPLKTSALSGATSFRVAGPEVASDYDGDTTLGAVRILKTDGSKVYAKVSSISLSSGDSVVNLAAGLSAAIDPATTVMISWMPAWRFASDELTIEWLTSSIAETKITFQMLEDRSGS